MARGMRPFEATPEQALLDDVFSAELAAGPPPRSLPKKPAPIERRWPSEATGGSCGKVVERHPELLWPDLECPLLEVPPLRRGARELEGHGIRRKSDFF